MEHYNLPGLFEKFYLLKKLIWTDYFGHDHDGNIWDWRESEIEDSWM